MDMCMPTSAVSKAGLVVLRASCQTLTLLACCGCSPCRYSKSLMRVIAEDGPPPTGLPLSRLLRYAGQALTALHELHSLPPPTGPLVVGDLKPQNLLLDASLDQLVVSDCGLSRAASSTIGSIVATAVGQGAPQYM